MDFEKFRSEVKREHPESSNYTRIFERIKEDVYHFLVARIYLDKPENVDVNSIDKWCNYAEINYTNWAFRFFMVKDSFKITFREALATLEYQLNERTVSGLSYDSGHLRTKRSLAEANKILDSEFATKMTARMYF